MQCAHALRITALLGAASFPSFTKLIARNTKLGVSFDFGLERGSGETAELVLGTNSGCIFTGPGYSQHSLQGLKTPSGGKITRVHPRVPLSESVRNRRPVVLGRVV